MINHYKSKYGLLQGALAYTKQQALPCIKGPKSTSVKQFKKNINGEYFNDTLTEYSAITESWDI